MGIDAPAYNHSSVGGIKFAHFNLHVSHAWCALVFVRSIERGSNYRIRSLWINAHTYILSFQSFWGVRWQKVGSGFLWGKRGLGLRWFESYLVLLEKKGGWADIKNGGQGRVVMVKTIIIYARLSVWAQ